MQESSVGIQTANNKEYREYSYEEFDIAKGQVVIGEGTRVGLPAESFIKSKAKVPQGNNYICTKSHLYAAQMGGPSIKAQSLIKSPELSIATDRYNDKYKARRPGSDKEKYLDGKEFLNTDTILADLTGPQAGFEAEERIIAKQFKITDSKGNPEKGINIIGCIKEILLTKPVYSYIKSYLENPNSEETYLIKNT